MMIPWARPLGLIAIAAAIAVLPMAFFGNSWGHDFDLHFPAWLEAAQQFRQGIVYPRWAAGANYGFGEPFFIFYPPLSWATGGALGLLLPWRMVPGAYVWLVLVAAGAAMWTCAKDWLDRPDAIMASLLFAVNPYLIVMVYKRCNYADLLAAALFPLLVWAAVRIGRDARSTILPLSLVFGATWLADLPAGVVAGYSLGLLLLLSTFLHRSVRPLLSGTISILVAFGGIAVFLFPAARERAWVDIGETLRPEWLPEHNFLFTQNNLPQYVSFNRGLSFIALLLVIGAATAGILARRMRRDAPDVWLSLVVLGGISTFLMLPPSLPLWRVLPELRFVEFPWRWLSALCVVNALLTASALADARRKWAWWMALALLVGAIGATVIRSVSWDSHHLDDLTVATGSGAGYRGLAHWSLPLGSEPSLLPKGAPLIDSTDAPAAEELTGQRVQVRVERWSPEWKMFSVESPRPLRLKIRLLAYPAWQATLNGALVSLEAQQGTGQMLLPVPAGFSRAELRFSRTWDRTLGIAVSVMTILAVLVTMLLKRRQKLAAPPGRTC